MRHDGFPPENKCYREHDDSFGVGYRGIQQGYLVTDQSESTGLLTRTHFGDETGWVYWESDSRAMGAWSQAPLAVVTTAGGLILPVRNQSLDADTRYAEKQLVTAPAADDPTQVLHLTGAWEEGDYGFVVQGSEDDAWELIFVPASVPAVYVLDTRFVTYTDETRARAGSSGSYYCYYLAKANTDVGFVDAADSWIFRVYSAYDSGTQTFSGLLQSVSRTHYQDINSLRVEVPGTGVPNKSQLVASGTHPFRNHVTEGYQGAIEVRETGTETTGTATDGDATSLEDTGKDFYYLAIPDDGSVSVTTASPTRTEPITAISGGSNEWIEFASGDAIVGGVTTYAIPAILRKSVSKLFVPTSAYNDWYYCPQWRLSCTVWASYDPVSDAAGSAPDDSGALYLAAVGNSAIGAGAGFHDEASRWILATSLGFGSDPKYDLPDLVDECWDGVTDRGNNMSANYWCDSGTFKDTRNYAGGLVYFPRAASSWKEWDPGTEAWVPMSPGSYSGFFRVYEEQGGVARLSISETYLGWFELV